MATVTPSLFYYQIDSLFNTLVVMTTYRARSLKSASGKSSFDECAMDDSDRDLFDEFLPVVAADVFQPISVIAKGVENGFRMDYEHDAGKPSIAYQVNLPSTFDMNQFNTLDIYLKQALEQGCLAKWYNHIEMPQLTQEHEFKFREAINALRSAVLYRTKAAKIPYRTF